MIDNIISFFEQVLGLGSAGVEFGSTAAEAVGGIFTESLGLTPVDPTA